MFRYNSPNHTRNKTVLTNDPFHILQRALEWRGAGRKPALATVIHTWGSAPRPVGSMLVVDKDRHFEGSVSGGCVETAVLAAAMEVIESAKPKMLEFGVSDARAWEVGLACGGEIRVYVQPVTARGLESVVTARARKRPVVLITDLQTGGQTPAFPDAMTTDDRYGASRVTACLRADRPALHTLAGVEHLYQPFQSPLRLLTVGAVHIAQPLLRIAAECDYEPTLIDPRETFASEARFPQATIRNDWPDAALRALAPDRRTAIVTLSHDPKLDDPALAAALGSEAFYIGSLGSKKTHRARLERLGEAGFDATQTARIHAPVGLAIGARSPAEIAVSIMAEIVSRARSA